MKKIKIKVIDQRCSLQKAHPSDACYDLVARLDSPILLRSEDVVLIPTGIIALLPPGWEARVYSRSGLSTKNSVSLVNGVGIIDAAYRGEIIVPMIYHDKRRIVNHESGSVRSIGGRTVEIKPGDRIAQIAFRRIPDFELEFIEGDVDVNSTDRGTSGFGSSGVSGGLK